MKIRELYRRRGIASALKVHSILHAHELGYTTLRTFNEDDNPMLQLNYQLGFIKQDSVLYTMAKTL